MNQSLIVFYMHGLGNQFMIIDLLQNQSFKLSQINFALIEKLLDQSKDYKIDQILILNYPSSSEVDFDYHIINCDGSIAEQCGNGARCIAKFINDYYPENKNDKYFLKTWDSKILELEYINDQKIRVVLEPESFAPEMIGLNLNQVIAVANHNNHYQFPKKIDQLDQNVIENFDSNFKLPFYFYAVSIGNPHLVINTAQLNDRNKSNQDFEKLNIKAIGRFFQNQTQLFKKSVNANFIKIINRNEIKLRTYERGAGETYACGSGACASFVALKADHQVAEKLTIYLTLGRLELSHQIDGKIEMVGPASFQETRKLAL